MQILIIDHFAVLRDALAQALQGLDNDDFEFFKASDLGQFARENPKIKPQVTFLMNSVSSPVSIHNIKDQQITLLKELYPKSRLIVCDNKPKENVKKYLKLGVDGYLSNEASLTDLKTCVQMVIEGKKFVEVDVLAQALHIPDTGTVTLKDKRFVGLSPMEQQVAELIMQGKSRADIAIAVDRAPGTVSEIQTRLLRKLGLANAHQLRRLASTR